MSPFLFIIVIDFIMRKAIDQPRFGIGWRNNTRLTDLDFADGIALMAEEDHVCLEMTTNLALDSAKFGLKISQEKTKIIRTDQTQNSRPIYIGQTELECVDQFTYQRMETFRRK